ncbi:MAG: response regulator [Paracoccaceae bacterium]
MAVDDEPSILELLKTYLEAADSHEVVAVDSGKEALAILDRDDAEFDCLLIDIQMPQMNGVDLCETIRANPSYTHVPVIMLTAMSQKKYIDKAFAAGATDYVTKPFDFLELKGRLQAAKRLVFEHNRAADSIDAARQLMHELDTEVKIGIDEPIAIDNVPGLVSYSAFENYILQLSRGSLLFATAIAVKLQGFERLHKELSARDLRAVLRRVATVLAEQMCTYGNLCSYRGNGIFLCISHRRNTVPTQALEMSINDSISYSKIDGLEPSRLRVIVGEEMSMRSISKSGALFALRRAIESAENRAITPRDVAALSKRALLNQSRTQQQAKLERRAYEVILEDIVKEEPGLTRS